MGVSDTWTRVSQGVGVLYVSNTDATSILKCQCFIGKVISEIKYTISSPRKLGLASFSRLTCNRRETPEYKHTLRYMSLVACSFLHFPPLPSSG
ncbi:hypothetical protein CsSME_00018725 [Camellia sinensis var. sinensis]